MVVGQLLITPTVLICIQQLGQVKEMMRYGIFGMRWVSELLGFVSGSGDSCLYNCCIFFIRLCGHWCDGIHNLHIITGRSTLKIVKHARTMKRGLSEDRNTPRTYMAELLCTVWRIGCASLFSSSSAISLERAKFDWRVKTSRFVMAVWNPVALGIG